MVNFKRVAEARKAEKMRQNLHMIGFGSQGNKSIKFVSSIDEIKREEAGRHSESNA